MIIHEENIEELMFEYFEGNLSAKEKEEVLSYIHQNPIHEKDFVQWAQSYAHIGEAPDNYELTKGLIRSKHGVFTGKRVFWAIVPLGILALLLWYGWPDVSVQKLETKKDLVGTLPKTGIDSTVLRPMKKAAVYSPIISERPTETKLDTHHFVDTPIQDSVMSPVSLDSTRKPIENILPVASTTVDTSSNHTNHLEKQVLSPKAIPKKKRKYPLNLKADPEFIQQNPNF